MIEQNENEMWKWASCLPGVKGWYVHFELFHSLMLAPLLSFRCSVWVAFLLLVVRPSEKRENRRWAAHFEERIVHLGSRGLAALERSHEATESDAGEDKASHDQDCILPSQCCDQPEKMWSDLYTLIPVMWFNPEKMITYIVQLWPKKIVFHSLSRILMYWYGDKQSLNRKCVSSAKCNLPVPTICQNWFTAIFASPNFFFAFRQRKVTPHFWFNESSPSLHRQSS